MRAPRFLHLTQPDPGRVHAPVRRSKFSGQTSDASAYLAFGIVVPAEARQTHAAHNSRLRHRPSWARLPSQDTNGLGGPLFTFLIGRGTATNRFGEIEHFRAYGRVILSELSLISEERVAQDSLRFVKPSFAAQENAKVVHCLCDSIVLRAECFPSDRQGFVVRRFSFARS